METPLTVQAMRRLSLYFFSLWLIVSVHTTSMAQNESTSNSSDSLKLEVKAGLQIYLDYGKVLTLATSFESKFEVGVAYQFKNKFSPNFQVGTSSLEPPPAFENGEYKSEGTFFKLGLNYALPFDINNMFYGGVKFGFASYSESGTYIITTDIWPDFEESFERNGLTANWYELILGSEKKMEASNWIIGGYFSLRILGSRDEFESIDTFAIPGYGRALDSTVPAVNLYLKYAF